MIVLPENFLRLSLLSEFFIDDCLVECFDTFKKFKNHQLSLKYLVS